MSDLPPDIAKAINLYRYAVKMCARAPMSGNAETEGKAYRALNAAILKHLSGGDDTVRVPRLFDADAEEEAWRHWTTGGRHHESFVRCINAYVRDAALAQTDTRRTEG